MAVAVGAPGTPSLLPQSVRPLPRALSGPFGGLGVDVHPAGAIALLAVMTAAYCVALRPGSHLSPRVVLVSVGVLAAAMLLAPPLLSTDVFSYLAYARMAREYGIDPYLHGPDAIRLDPVFPYIGARWTQTPTVYGPLFTGLSELFARLSIASAVLAFKAVAVASELALVALVWAAARRRGLRPERAAALVGLNPLLVVYGVGAGHNDVLMLAVLAGAVLVLLAGQERRGGALVAAAVALKLTAIVVLPFALVSGGRAAGWPPRRRLLAGALAVAVPLAAFGVLRYGTGVSHVVGTLAGNQRHGDVSSIPGAIGRLLHAPAAGQVVGDALIGLFAAVTAWQLTRVWRGRGDWIDAAAWSTAALLVSAGSLQPWYMSWLLPLAALGRSPRLRAATLALTVVVQAVALLGIVPHG